MSKNQAILSVLRETQFDPTDDTKNFLVGLLQAKLPGEEAAFIKKLAPNADFWKGFIPDFDTLKDFNKDDKDSLKKMQEEAASQLIKLFLKPEHYKSILQNHHDQCRELFKEQFPQLKLDVDGKVDSAIFTN